MTSSDTRRPRSAATDDAAARMRVTAGCSPAVSARSTRRGSGRSSSGSSYGMSSVSPKSSASGNVGVGAGANGPSRIDIWSYPTSGKTPDKDGYFALNVSIDANRRAATAASGDPPQISGKLPTMSSASDLPGFTNDSLDGLHWWETSSSAAAGASNASGGSRKNPSRALRT